MNQVKTYSFMNGDVLIGEVEQETGTWLNAFILNIIENPETRERFPFFRPVARGRKSQSFTQDEIRTLVTPLSHVGPSVAPEELAGTYLSFTEDEQQMNQCIEKYTTVAVGAYCKCDDDEGIWTPVVKSDDGTIIDIAFNARQKVKKLW